MAAPTLDARFVANNFEFVGLQSTTYALQAIAAAAKGTQVLKVELDSGYVGVIIGLGIVGNADLTYHVKMDGVDVFEQNITRSFGTIAQPRTWDMDKSPIPVMTNRLLITADSTSAGANAEVLVEIARFRVPEGWDSSRISV